MNDLSQNNDGAGTVVSLDVGEKRIGIAYADTKTRIAIAYRTIEVDGMEIDRIREIVTEKSPAIIVIGLPRNQSGETTEQTEKVRQFASKIENLGVDIVFQDESLTSVQAEKQLKDLGKPYEKADIDAAAAAIILKDYLEINFGR